MDPGKMFGGRAYVSTDVSGSEDSGLGFFIGAGLKRTVGETWSVMIFDVVYERCCGELDDAKAGPGSDPSCVSMVERPRPESGASLLSVDDGI